jgi:hypothetical protein
LLLSPASFASATPPDKTTLTSGEAFDGWKARLRTRAVHILEEYRARYRRYLRPFTDAVRTGDIRTVENFLAKSDRHLLEVALGHTYYLAKDPKLRRSALQLAVIFGSPGVAKLLLDFAARHEEFAEIILGIDEAGQSALQMAIFLNETSVVAEFLAFTAKHPAFSRLVFVPNPRGESIIESARRYGRHEILHMMREPELLQFQGLSTPKCVLFCALPVAALVVYCLLFRDFSKE